MTARTSLEALILTALSRGQARGDSAPPDSSRRAEHAFHRRAEPWELQAPREGVGESSSESIDRGCFAEAWWTMKHGTGEGVRDVLDGSE